MAEMGREVSKRVHHRVRCLTHRTAHHQVSFLSSPRPYRYPERIPDAVSVPAWAYLNVAVSKNFSVSAAAGDTDPDITAGSPTGPAIPVWPNATVAPSPVASNTFSQGRQHSFDLYALIGIVTGGVLVLAVAFGLAETYYMRRKRRRQAAASGGENSEERGEAQVGATGEAQMGTTDEAQVMSEAGDSTGPAFDMPSMPPIPEGDSSEIQLVARDSVRALFYLFWRLF